MQKPGKRFTKFSLVALLAGSLIILSFKSLDERYFEIAKNLDIFASLFKEVNALYVDDINPNQLIRTGIDAMLESLDPYTNFIGEDEVENYRTANTGQYGGIGIATREIGSRMVISMVMAGHNAEKQGLKIGDEIVGIAGLELKDIDDEQFDLMMKGQIGKPVMLTLKRPGVDQLITVDVPREHIKISNVPHFEMVSDKVGYLQLTEFTQEAGLDVKKAVEGLRKNGAKGIILDLRGNPGGLLLEAVNVCNVFLPKGKLVVSTKGKMPDHNMTYETLDEATDTDIPVIILVDRGSASASEIVAGTLQDYDRAVVLGERSYGKGLVQVSRPLSYNSQLKVTTAKYYTPSGRCIQVLDYGHRRADGSVASVPDSLKKAFKTSLNRVVYDGGGIEPDIKMTMPEVSPFANALEEQGLIFDYVTQYIQSRTTTPDPATYMVSDAEFSAFEDWLKTKTFIYESRLEETLRGFKKLVEQEKYDSDLEPNITQLEKKIAEGKKNELSINKEQIKLILANEILSRYFLDKGTIQSQLSHDDVVAAAIAVLNNPVKYNGILVGIK